MNALLCSHEMQTIPTDRYSARDEPHEPNVKRYDWAMSRLVVNRDPQRPTGLGAQWGTHLAAVVGGAIIAVATLGEATPTNSERYQALDAFAQALHLVQTEHVDSIRERALIYGAIEGMLAKLDPYSAFFTPKRYQRLRQDTQGKFVGIGLALKKAAPTDDPPFPIVDRVVAGSPAAQANIYAGDRIVAIDELITASPGQKKRRAHSFHSLLRGTPGTIVSLKVARKGRALQVVKLKRTKIVVPSVESWSFGDDTGYVRILRFQDATATELAAAIDANNSRRVVLDLRNNPGGLVSQAIAVADLFLSRGTVVQVLGRRGTLLEKPQATQGSRFEAIGLVVLVDERTASSAEIVAAALRDNHRAPLFGKPTFGKGSVQTFFDLPGGAGIKLTTARYLSPAGQLIHERGIKPDYDIEAFAPDVFVAGNPQYDPLAVVRKKWPHLRQIVAERLESDFQLHEAYSWLLDKEVK